MIIVKYETNRYSVCMGTLKIFDGSELIYDKEFCCHSTGRVTLEGDPDEWNWVVEEGNLCWNEEDASEFSEEIQEAVRDELSNYRVCCGGCC